ncbi:putative amidophosphoribosyltransferase [Micromonospora violae]|uniref:Putative amidophosphoribosyltransferase n=1 Tax=Micromonospora violae TaxID=1278207 RepID=A0A4Q7UMV5_9ACTN|nr:ComF family protein [Micromonospora violae]RZT82786.1 putative amidophosphoribosyltransferase [Micromonospora violae]
MSGLWADLADLVLPADCAGCRERRPGLRHGVCPACVAALDELRPRAVRPSPAPPGLPSCVALGPYAGPLRAALLAYKEDGRHGLARPLGALLAEVVAAAVGEARPLALVPVPDTAAAARSRYGDHLDRLARHCAARLNRGGWSVRVRRPLRALPRPDSLTLDSAGRAAAAEAAFQPRSTGPNRGRGASAAPVVVLLDDIVTTGVTLAAASRVLTTAGWAPGVAAVLAATEKRRQL